MENEYKKKYLKYKKLYFNLLNNLGNDLVKSKSLQIGGASRVNINSLSSNPSVSWGFISVATLKALSLETIQLYQRKYIITSPYPNYVNATSHTYINRRDIPIYLGQITNKTNDIIEFEIEKYNHDISDGAALKVSQMPPLLWYDSSKYKFEGEPE
tara:strand:- start:307 stop:774 length:468 start_codon:yes stop_codon:yes gene_type:complete